MIATQGKKDVVKNNVKTHRAKLQSIFRCQGEVSDHKPKRSCSPLSEACVSIPREKGKGRVRLRKHDVWWVFHGFSLFVSSFYPLPPGDTWILVLRDVFGFNIWCPTLRDSVGYAILRHSGKQAGKVNLSKSRLAAKVTKVMDHSERKKPWYSGIIQLSQKLSMIIYMYVCVYIYICVNTIIYILGSA